MPASLPIKGVYALFCPSDSKSQSIANHQTNPAQNPTKALGFQKLPPAFLPPNMAEPLNTIINKPKRIQVSSSTFLFTISISLVSFTFLCLSSKDTTFWFLLSNAIIFFVAADSNASSPSKSKSDIYDEYMKIARSRNMYAQHAYRASVSPSSLPTILDGDTETEAFEKHTGETVDSGDMCSESETEKAIVAVESKENMPHELETGHNETDSNSFSPSKPKPKPHLCIEYLKEEKQEEKEASDIRPSGNAKPGHRYCRSESEKAIVAVEREGRVLRRSETEKGGGESDNSDFSAMSNEELNRRFEEFIQRLNRQIRLEEI